MGELLEPVTAKCMFEPPEPPRSLRVTDVSNKVVSIKWREPTFNGGSLVTEYQLYKRNKKDSKWVQFKTLDNVQLRNLEITDVLECEECEFQMTCKNAAGIGEPSNSTGLILVKDPIFPPSPPFELRIDVLTKDHAELGWQMPNVNGGAEILGYYIERSVGDDWARANTVAIPGDITKGRVDHLRPGRTYAFRVTAFNAAGMSEPCEPTDTVIAVDPDCEPTVDLEEEKRCLIVGQKLRCTVRYGGVPLPNIEWQKDENELPMNVKTKVAEDASGPYSSCFIPDIQRS